VLQGEGEVLEGFVEFFPIDFNGALLSRNVLDLCEKLTVFFRMDKILLETSFHWLSDDIVRFKIKMGFMRNVQKCNIRYTQKISAHCTLIFGTRCQM